MILNLLMIPVGICALPTMIMFLCALLCSLQRVAGQREEENDRSFYRAWVYTAICALCTAVWAILPVAYILLT